jgi:hypothetical protein
MILLKGIRKRNRQVKEASDRFWLVKKSAERDCQALGLAYLSGTYVREAARDH